MDIAPIHAAMSGFVKAAWAEKKYAGVLGPWRHGKSRSLIIGLAALEVGRNQNVRIRIICADDREAVLRVSAVRRLIESPRYQRIFPNVRPLEGEWLKQQFIVQRSSGGVDPTVAAAGVFAAEAGGGHDIIMIDDVVTYQNAYLSPATRDQVYQTLTAVWLRRIDPGTRIVATGTAWHCLHPDTPVVTQRGLVLIQDVVPGDRVRGSAGRWVSVRRVGSRPPDRAVTLRIAGDPESVVSSTRHRWWTSRGWVHAGDLRKGDVIGTRISPASPWRPRAEPLRSSRTFAPKSGRERTGVKGPRGWSLDALRAWLVQGKSAGEFASLHGIARSAAYAWARWCGVTANTHRHHVRPGYTRDPLFWHFVGAWLAEGTVESHAGRWTLSLGVGAQDAKIVADVARLCDRYGVRWRRYQGGPNHHNVQIRGIAHEWCKFLVKHFGTGSRGKHVPWWAETLPRDARRALILGYWRGDGCGGSAYRIASVNLTMLRQIQGVIFAAGAWASIQRESPTSYGERYSLRFSRRDALKLGFEDVQPVRRQRRGTGWVDGGIVWRTVQSVTPSSYAGPLWDLQTEDGGFHLPHGLVHNSDDAYHRLRREQKNQWKWLIVRVGPDFRSLVCSVD